MTGDAIDRVVGDALALLIRLRSQRVAVDVARACVVELRERYPGRFIHLIWEHESYGDKIHYDLLVEVDGGTLSIAYCADEDVPWPARGLQRVSEALVLRVNGEPVQVDQVVNSLDYAWHKLHVGRHLIHMSLIDQAIHGRKIEVTDDQLAAALTAFRVQRRLFTAAAVEQWMVDHGASAAQLEQQLRADAARGELRRQVTGGPDAHAAYFAAHRADFDRVQVAKIHVADRAAAEALRGELRDAPQRFLAAAQQRYLQDGGHGELFATLRRGELDGDEAAALFETEPGRLAPVVVSGDGFEVVQVLRRLPAVLDDDTARAIGDLLFERWLDGQRAGARIEWFWGAAEAEIPALQL